MTVLGNTRRLPAGAVRMIPGTARPAGATARRRLSRPDRARAGRRAHPVGVLLAAVLVAFLLGLMYVAQTVQLAAVNYQIDVAVAARDDLYRQVQTIETSVLRWGTEPTVLERAQQLGLDQLPTRARQIAR